MNDMDPLQPRLTSQELTRAFIRLEESISFFHIDEYIERKITFIDEYIERKITFEKQMMDVVETYPLSGDDILNCKKKINCLFL